MKELKGAYNTGSKILNWEDKEFMDNFYKQVDYLQFENRVTSVEQRVEELYDIFLQNTNKPTKEKKNQSLNYEDEQSKLVLKDATEYEDLIERSLVLLDNMRDNDDLRIQIQYTTILIKKIDKIRSLDVVKNNKSRMKIFAFLRLVLKINCDEVLFNNEQIDLFCEAFEKIEKEEDSKNYVNQYTFSFMDIGLTTMPSWE